VCRGGRGGSEQFATESREGWVARAAPSPLVAPPPPAALARAPRGGAVGTGKARLARAQRRARVAVAVAAAETTRRRPGASTQLAARRQPGARARAAAVLLAGASTCAAEIGGAAVRAVRAGQRRRRWQRERRSQLQRERDWHLLELTSAAAAAPAAAAAVAAVAATTAVWNAAIMAYKADAASADATSGTDAAVAARRHAFRVVAGVTLVAGVADARAVDARAVPMAIRWAAQQAAVVARVLSVAFASAGGRHAGQPTDAMLAVAGVRDGVWCTRNGGERNGRCDAPSVPRTAIRTATHFAPRT
jgi:hypothetical protein